MTKYAATTDVTPDRTQADIRRTVQRFGATSFAYGERGDRAMIGFELAGLQYRFDLPLPSLSDDRFWKTANGRARRSATTAHAAYDQEVRSRWRALALSIKAKFAAVEAGISTVEREFLPNVVLPGGTTVGDEAPRAIASMYATGQVQPLLALPGSR